MATVLGTEDGDLIGYFPDDVTDLADYIKGYGGNDTIYGLGGNDIIVGGAGHDWLYGGDGNDKLYGDDGQDWLHGEGGTDTLSGGAGRDYLFGGEGADTLYGGEGMDALMGGAGADMLDGGSENDNVQYLNSPAGVFVNLQSGTGSGGDAEGDQLISIENVHGSDFSDTVWGDGGANQFHGGDGSDELKGVGGDDCIWGDSGNDTLYGGAGRDVLFGGDGADHIDGGLNGIFGDSLTGGDGPDTFVWRSTAETEYDLANIACSTDVIGDFNRSEGDVIDLSAIDADETISGNQAFTTFIGAGRSSGNPGEISYFYEEGDTYIRLQTNTSPEADGMIRLVGIHTPEASWFVL